MEKQRCQAGFTLIELLIAVSILGILMTGVTAIYRTGIISSDSNENLINLQNEARVIKRMVENDVRSSTGDFEAIEFNGDTVGFKIDDNIEYREDNDSLVREADGSEHVLTNNLENFDFTINENGLVSIDDITLRSDRGMEYAFSDRVYARRIGVALGGGSGGDDPGDGDNPDDGDDEITVYFRMPDWAGEGPNLWINDQGEDYFDDLNNVEMDDSGDWAKYTIETTNEEVEVAFQVVFWEDGDAKTLYAGDDYDDWKTYKIETGEIWIDASEGYNFGDYPNEDNYYLPDGAYSNNSS